MGNTMSYKPDRSNPPRAIDKGNKGNSMSFKPQRDIPDLSGKVILVTGGSLVSPAL